MPETHLIPLILQVATGQRESIRIYGTDYPTPDGTCVRDYIHVSDLTRAHLLALEALLNGGGNSVYNLGNSTGYSVQQVIETARSNNRSSDSSQQRKPACRRSGRVDRGLHAHPQGPGLGSPLRRPGSNHRVRLELASARGALGRVCPSAVTTLCSCSPRSAGWGSSIIFPVSTGQKLPLLFPGQDKLAHLVMFGILGFLLTGAVKAARQGFRARSFWFVVALVALYGISDELHQLFVPGRSADILDVLADAVGGLLGAGLMVLVSRIIRRQGATAE